MSQKRWELINFALGGRTHLTGSTSVPPGRVEVGGVTFKCQLIFGEGLLPGHASARLSCLRCLWVVREPPS